MLVTLGEQYSTLKSVFPITMFFRQIAEAKKIEFTLC